MKKIIIFLILTFSIISLSSCTNQPINTDSKKQIVVTLYPQYQMVKAILGSDKVLNSYYDVSLIVPYGCDIHNYDPSMSDLLLIKRAYAFIYTADEMETWVSLLKFSENTHVLNLANDPRIKLLEVEESEDEHGHEHDEEHDHSGEHHNHNHTYDPHIWIYPLYASYMVEKIRDLLVDITPDPYYPASGITQSIINNAQIYIDQLLELDIAIKQIVDVAQTKTLYFGSPFAFYYWTVYYDLNYVLTYKTCSTEIDPSLNDISHIVHKMKEDNAKVIYSRELISDSAAKMIAENTGAKVLELHSGHNISNKHVGLEEYSFINIMIRNIYNLAEGLGVDTNQIEDFILRKEA